MVVGWKENYKNTETKETGNEENKMSIKFNKFEINFGKGVSKFKIYDTMVSEKKFRLFSDFYLPISIIKRTNKELENIQRNYSVEEAKEIKETKATKTTKVKKKKTKKTSGGKKND